MAPKKQPVTKTLKRNRRRLEEVRRQDDEEVEMEGNFSLISKDNSRDGNPEPEDGAGQEDDDLGLEEGSGEEWSCSEVPDEDNDSSETGSDGDSDDGDDRGHGDIRQRHSQIKTEDDIRKELSTMSFEDIMKLQNKVGRKVYNEVAYGEKTEAGPAKKKKRLNKNRPMEISSKKPAPFLRQVVPVKKKLLRDPRFDNLSGEFKPEIFEKTYSFLNDVKQKEKMEVQKMLKKVKEPNKKEQLQLLLRRMVNQESAQESKARRREKELEFKKKQRQLVEQGHRPFFLKKSDKRKLELAEKYSDLKKSGKLENFLKKKRKRNAVKDRKKLPFTLKVQ
ncbi:ribosomal RNA processing protein 36 homolog [Scleropages formosus]|uniref:rRNA biogenesis protein RRP36 n=1 Tax=Scleropages formosus TaxID=113540 RepID=A0A8C9SF37_SCLFO|nr:ribosomal RNA processing protein 36 homolog [Scleropages formosus]XP_018606362.2 ribosomal RNA processing protein 36 homolog [Scleropages formosus]